MRSPSPLWIVVALAACDGKETPTAEAPKTSQPENTKAGEAEAERRPKASPDHDPAPVPEPAADPRLVEVPPPAEVLLPKVGTLRTLEPAPKGAAYDWQAIYEVDPDDPRIAEVLAEGFAHDAGDAGATLYHRQAKAAGRDVDGAGTYASYPIEGGARTVMILSADHSHHDDPTGFTIVVGITGG